LTLKKEDFMAIKERPIGPAVKAVKLASVKRLCATFATAQRNGTLRPVNAAAKPILVEMRVNAV
jgi:hypothetical protein